MNKSSPNPLFIGYLVLVIVIGLASPALAADIEVYTDRNPVGLNESFRLVYKATQQVDGDPDFSPLEQYLDILNRSQSSNVSILNGRYESSVTWTLTAMPRQEGDIDLPAISFGADRSPSYKLTVKGAAQQPAGQSNFFTQLRVSRKQLYVQQQLVITQQIYSATNLTAHDFGDLRFSGMDVIVEPLGDEKQYRTALGQRPYLVIEKRYAVFPQASGRLKLEPALVGGRQQAPRSNFFDPFAAQSQVLRARSNGMEIEVLPLPADADMPVWLPAGELELAEEWAQEPPEFIAGEPVTRTLSLKAEGLTAAQLPELPQVEIDGLKQYPDQPLLNDVRNDTGITGYRVQKVAFIPTRAGSFELPAIEIPWWDTRTQRRRVARIPARQIRVAPAVNAAPSVQSEVDQPLPSAGAAAQPGDPRPAPRGLSEGLASNESDATAGFWPVLTLVTTVGWALTIAIWILQARAPISRRIRHDPDRSLKQHYRTLIRACKAQDAAACRGQLLVWLQELFADRDVHVLRDVQPLLPENLTVEMRKLDAVLYGGGQESVDFEQIQRSASAMMKRREEAPTSDRAQLEPLYK